MWHHGALNTVMPTMLMSKTDGGMETNRAAAGAGFGGTGQRIPLGMSHHPASAVLSPEVPGELLASSSTPPPSSWIQDATQTDMPTRTAAAETEAVRSSINLVSAGEHFNGEQILRMPAPPPSSVSPPPLPYWFEDGSKADMPTRAAT